MPARTQQRRTPAIPVGRASSGGADTRLPWWSLALPVLAFAVLFGLLTGSGEAHAAGGDPAVARILEQIQHTLAR
ncbi:hypothetical protein ACF068_24355 [Streptomyces sp. NPDC016309]|uniref:hypothetical protein n=1 Tax=Streptomyces sp. NPDC016309 TaxID=3364965 RepID=UPI0036FC455D